MKIKYLVSLIFIISLALLGSAYLSDKVFAQDSGLANIQYPVAELGGCKNEAACKAYCDKPGNIEACLDFAQKNNLMSDEEIQKAKNFMAAGSKGPGGCAGQDSCEAYCNDISHIDECVSYAEKNNLMSPQELEEAKKVKAAIDRGVKPPACKSKKECDTYCEDADHMQECISFGVEAGFIQGKELEDAQKMLAAIKKGIKPPPCKGKDACDQYCSSPDNIEVCMNFALAAGMMSEEEAANSEKMLAAIRKGVKPPLCKGKEACDVYCSSEEHMQECIDFSVAAGFMSEKDAEMAKKTGGKGPGGCKGKEECEAFCNTPENQEACFNFAKDNGMIPEEELKKMDEGRQQFRKSFDNMPAEVLTCLQEKLGAEMVEKMKNGTVMPSRETGDEMRVCFEIMGPPQQGGPGEGGMIPPSGQAGPGGCKTSEECQKYCQDNPDECQKFQPGPGAENPGGQIMPPQAGPGGCKTPEECQKYCESDPEACKNFGGGEQQFAPGTGPNNMQGQPCEGENCKYGPPPQGQQPMQPGQPISGQPCEGPNCQYGPPPQGQQPPITGQPCEGENCPQVQPMQPGQQQYAQPLEGSSGGQMPPPDGQLPPPPTGPGAGGQIAPGEQQAPLAPPVEQQPQQPAPTAPPPPPEPGPTSFLYNPDSLVASAATALLNLLFGK